MGQGPQEAQFKGGFVKASHGGVPRGKGDISGSLRGTISFANVVRNRVMGGALGGDTSNDNDDSHCTSLLPRVKYVDKETKDSLRFEKAYIWVVEVSGKTFKMQEHFNMEGYFDFKISHLGPNFCLLEDRVSGVLEDIITRDQD